MTWDKFSGNDFVPEVLVRCCVSICKDKPTVNRLSNKYISIQLLYHITNEIITGPFNYFHVMHNLISKRAADEAHNFV